MMQSPLNYENPSFLQVHDIAALMFYYHITYGKSFLVAKSDKHTHCHNLRKNGDYILGVVFYPKPSSVSDVAGIQSVHASLN